MGTLILIVLALYAPIGLFWAWKIWYGTSFTIEQPQWRGAIAVVGLLTVTGQAVTTLIFFFSNIALWIVARTSLAIFPVAVMCIMLGKSNYRWWLLSSSCVFFIIGFFTALSA